MAMGEREEEGWDEDNRFEDGYAVAIWDGHCECFCGFWHIIRSFLVVVCAGKRCMSN